MNLLRHFSVLLALPALLWAAESPGVKNGSVRVSLVSANAAIEAGKPFTIALRMHHDPHWHSYWIAAGTGYPTSINWTLPTGFKAGEIQWPTPTILRDSTGKIVGNGYSEESFLLVEITPPAFRASENPRQISGDQEIATVPFAPGSKIKLAAATEWLMCQDVCMPGEAKLEIALDVAAAAQPDARWAQPITQARAQLPIAATEWNLTAAHDEKNVTLRLIPKSGNTHKPTNLHFFATDAFTDYTQLAKVTAENDGWVLVLPLDAVADKTTKRLTGVLASANGWTAGASYGGLAIDVAFSADEVPTLPTVTHQTSNPTPPSTSLAAPSSLLATLGLAFIGGLILNLMPCVFPVLGIKILGFVNQSGNDRKKITAHGLTFTLGVLVSFWALAGALLILRAGGAQLGWGFQLQSPVFVFGMAVFLLIFALNLSGLFEVGLSATSVGGNLQMQDGFAGSFFTGALATLVATPCSAPFLAPALGAALSLSAGQAFLIFTAIALGLALPYLLFSIFPQAIKLLPKPGAWMETFTRWPD